MRRCSLVLVLALVACGDNSKPPPDPVDPGGPNEVRCEVLPTTATTCTVTAGSTTKLIKGNVLTPETVFLGGQVAVDEAGKISCVGCNCAAGGETTIVCADAAISPGLINTHDHITFTQNNPYTATTERYEDRQQWRGGLDDHTEIPAPGGASGDQIRWGELRFVMGGATSIVGAGSQLGLLRNLDTPNGNGPNHQEGLGQKPVEFEVFPLGDGSGRRRVSDCDYGGGTAVFTAARIANVDSFEPHTAEGVNTTARNEFLCETSATYDTAIPGTSNDLMLAKTSMIHAIGLQPADYGAMAAAGTGLIWSPRSNITLYGETARVTTAARLGVRIALGTDWMPTGSMNLLRELACADAFNTTYLEGFFTDDELWKMVTVNAALATATDDVIGVLETGKIADIAIFASRGKKPFRSVIEAEPKDVALVMRAGKVLYGDDIAVGALAESCDTVDVCGSGKRVCAMGEVAKSYAALQAGAGASTYPAFACGVPQNEPTCIPSRPVAVDGSTVYTGIGSAADSDGDGVANADDNCPRTFNPVRPVDRGVQGDADLDGEGDACDTCPLDADTEQCMAVSLADRDDDGTSNLTDNCVETPNRDQADADADGKGNACDACPMTANPGAAPCATTIYDIKRGVTGQHFSVKLSNVLVTGRGSNGIFVQIKEGDTGYNGPDHSGMFVFTGTPVAPETGPPAAAAIGARINIEGTVTVFQGQLEIDAVTKLEQVAAGPEALPAPVQVSYADIKTGGPRAAALEGVLVTVTTPAQVTAFNAAFGETTLTDLASNTLVTDDFLFALTPPPVVTHSYDSVTGILAFRQRASKLLPRSAADFVSGAPALLALGPALSFARVGATTGLATFPQPLTLTLTGPAKGATTVTLTSGDPLALTVLDVIVPDGATTAAVPVTALLQAADVTLTGSLTNAFGTQTRDAHVRVLADIEAPTTVTLSPSAASIRAGSSVTLTVTLDLPALTPATVTLDVEPDGAGTLPTSIDVAADQLSATFTYTDTTANPTVTITASFLASTSSSAVAVEAVNHLIINEVDYDQSINPDSTEFVEIFNPTSADISLTGKSLVLINGNGGTPYGTIDLGPAGNLPSKGYLVVTGATVTVPAPALKLNPGWTTDAVQNGAPDGLVLIDTVSHTVIDALSYEGSIAAANLSTLGFTSPVSLVEGTVLPTTTADAGNGSLCRSPDGRDTDNAATDWKACSALTIGAANPTL